MKTYKIIEETEKAVKLSIRCLYVNKEDCTSVINYLTAEKSELKTSESDFFVWCPKSAIDAEGNLSSWFIKQTSSKFSRARAFSFMNAEGNYDTLYA